MGAGKPEESIPTELVQPGTISEAGPPSPRSQDGQNASLGGHLITRVGTGMEQKYTDH